ncbi:hypothetical protein [Spiroplasma sp. AdecLV25b]|uniref:hypothetical protein n=1 Tax=Spiroplasma sp. AdecLV25b TaxID=3027162 RepID=UPI0027E1A6B0|nr:hypothetical protein [Spiroplasma sp. AdecLV25b]
MFNEQYFSKSYSFLTFTMLSIPPLLASLLVNGIIGTVVIDINNNFKRNIIFGLGIGFLFLSLILSFLLKEKSRNMGMHNLFVLKEIKPFQIKKIVILIVIGLSIYIVYYLLNNNYFNYKNDMITHNETLKPYRLLITYLPQVLGVFILGWWLYYYFNAQFTLIVSFSLWLLGIVINYVSTNLYAILYAHIIFSLAFGSTSFVIYSSVLDWNYRQRSPLTGIYSTIITITTFSNDLFISYVNNGIINNVKINSELFYFSNIFSLVVIVSLIVATAFTHNYWLSEKYDKLIKIKKLLKDY